MAGVRVALADEYRLKLELLEAELEGRTAALKTKLESAEQGERAAKEALTSFESTLASTRADLSSLQQQIEDVTSLVEKTTDEANRRRTM